MKKHVNKITILFTSYLLICAMGILLVNFACNSHTHRLPDGTVITHAHPYDKSANDKPDESHHHSKADFVFINALSLLFPFLILTFVTKNVIKHKRRICDIFQYYISVFAKSLRGRAPPIY